MDTINSLGIDPSLKGKLGYIGVYFINANSNTVPNHTFAICFSEIHQHNSARVSVITVPYQGKVSAINYIEPMSPSNFWEFRVTDTGTNITVDSGSYRLSGYAAFLFY